MLTLLMSRFTNKYYFNPLHSRDVSRTLKLHNMAYATIVKII